MKPLDPGPVLAAGVVAPVRAAIFDMDGTLVFNMAFHAAAWVETAAEIGVSGLLPSLFESELAGLKNEEVIPRILGRAVDLAEIAKIAERKEDLYRQIYGAHLALAPGLAVLLDRFEASGIRSAVATAAPESNREFVLDGLKIRNRFEVVVGAEQVALGKPSPDLFLAAMSTLGVPQSECIVFEDAVNGVLAAVSAGARCIGVTSVTPAARLLEAGAEMTIDAFDPLPAQLEAILFGRL